MRSPRPWRMFGPLGLVLLLLAGWSAFWLYASAAARSAADAARQRLAADGIRLDCAGEKWGGYPFRFEFTCDSPRLSTPQGTATATRLAAIAQAYNPRHLILLIDGPSAAEGFSQDFDMRHGRILVSLIVEDGRLSRFSAEIPDPVIRDRFTAGKLFIHGRAQPAGVPELAVSGEGVRITIPDQANLSLDEVAAVVSPGPGRTLEVSSVSLRQGNVKLWGKGRIGLDGRNRLSGQIATAANDLDGLLNAAAPYLRMSPEDRAALKLVLGFFGKEVKADMIFRDGELYWGPLRLGELGPVY